jgi:Zn ribbon nucleic-acid-binding protein
MDEFFAEKEQGARCFDCSEKTGMQNFIDDGLKTHSCSKCSYCLPEFSFHESSKKQKCSYADPDDGLQFFLQIQQHY